MQHLSGMSCQIHWVVSDTDNDGVPINGYRGYSWTDVTIVDAVVA